VKNLILTNAAGSLDSRYQPGTICSISDVDPTYLGHSPLSGDLSVIKEHFGPPFPTMNPALDPKLQELAAKAAEDLDWFKRNVTYTAIPGPPFESALQAKGFPLTIDLSGMSSVAELMAAQQLGMRTAIISLVTNMISREVLLPGSGVTHESVLHVVQQKDVEFAAYLARFVELVGEEVRATGVV
jgi:purine-nucleoside phosphorylase